MCLWGSDDNSVYCACGKLLYHHSTSPALPILLREPWESSACKSQTAEKPGLRVCKSKQKRIIRVLFSVFTAGKCNPRNHEYVLVACSLAQEVYSE